MIQRLKLVYDALLLKKYAYQTTIKKLKEKSKHKGKPISSGNGNIKIREFIENGKPAAIGKIGTTELKCLNIYDYNNTPLGWSKMKKTDGRYFGGIFPDTPELFNSFSEIYSKALGTMDLLGIWYNAGEHRVINKYAPDATLVDKIQCLESFYFDEPWSASLMGKKVLVIHPFEQSINKQFANRQKVWSSKNVLPDFELIILKIPQNAGVEKPPFPDWVSTLNHIKIEMSKIDFDIALIGAGGWSIPLATHAKNMGNIGIHIGGGLQIMFGIKGGRWSSHPFISSLFNQHWINILDEDKPNMNAVKNIPMIDQYW